MNALTTIEAANPQLWLDLPKDQTFDEWSAVGEKLNRTERVLNWWIGDWWAAGSHRYGERAKAAAEGIFGREMQTLMNAASVCRAFETSRRRETLSWSHHVEVAPLAPADADGMLDRAETERLSRNDLRKAVQRLRAERGDFAPQPGIDWDERNLNRLIAMWNQSSANVRTDFLEMATEVGPDLIAQ